MKKGTPQYLKIENGTPEIVISKRRGRTAFNYFLFLSSGEWKYLWYFHCHGGQKFVIEKDYTYSPRTR